MFYFLSKSGPRGGPKAGQFGVCKTLMITQYRIKFNLHLKEYKKTISGKSEKSPWVQMIFFWITLNSVIKMGPFYSWLRNWKTHNYLQLPQLWGRKNHWPSHTHFTDFNLPWRGHRHLERNKNEWFWFLSNWLERRLSHRKCPKNGKLTLIWSLTYAFSGVWLIGLKFGSDKSVVLSPF